jgi:hypothetical protein
VHCRHLRTRRSICVGCVVQAVPSVPPSFMAPQCPFRKLQSSTSSTNSATSASSTDSASSDCTSRVRRGWRWGWRRVCHWVRRVYKFIVEFWQGLLALLNLVTQWCSQPLVQTAAVWYWGYDTLCRVFYGVVGGLLLGAVLWLGIWKSEHCPTIVGAESALATVSTTLDTVASRGPGVCKQVAFLLPWLGPGCWAVVVPSTWTSLLLKPVRASLVAKAEWLNCYDLLENPDAPDDLPPAEPPAEPPTEPPAEPPAEEAEEPLEETTAETPRVADSPPPPLYTAPPPVAKCSWWNRLVAVFADTGAALGNCTAIVSPVTLVHVGARATCSMASNAKPTQLACLAARKWILPATIGQPFDNSTRAQLRDFGMNHVESPDGRALAQSGKTWMLLGLRAYAMRLGGKVEMLIGGLLQLLLQAQVDNTATAATATEPESWAGLWAWLTSTSVYYLDPETLEFPGNTAPASNVPAGAVVPPRPATDTLSTRTASRTRIGRPSRVLPAHSP